MSLISKLKQRVSINQWDRLVKISSLFLSHKKYGYSQYGEDFFLREFFKDKHDGFFVDVGSFHPKKFSNTYFLYKKGWRGINIDATPGSSKLFNLLRPKDINIEALVSSESGKEYSFASWGTNSENSASPVQIEGVSANFKKDPTKITLKAKTLTEILKNHMPYLSEPTDKFTRAGISILYYPHVKIDLLTVDVEDMDLEVLKSLDWNEFNPTVVITETYQHDVSALLTDPIYLFMVDKGYSLRSWYRNSLIFVRDKV